MLRAQVNRVLAALTLFVSLPLVVVAERVHRGWGRRYAVWAIRTLCRAAGVRVEVDGLDQLVPGERYVFVPNHRSHLDIPAMFLARPSSRFVATQELFRIPLLASAMRALDTVPVDRGAGRRSRRQLTSLAEPGAAEDVVIFADGRIVLPGEEPAMWKTGAFLLAVETGATIVPVAIHGAAALGPPNRRLVIFPGTIRVELLAPVSTEGLARVDRKRLRNEVQATVESALV